LKVEHNISRLKYLLDLYDISVEDLSKKISVGLKNPITHQDLFSKEIKLTHLKRVDKFFDKGLHFYLDPKAPETSKEASVFFRKDKFNSELNVGVRKIVNEFEEFKISLTAISKLADLNIRRVFNIYKPSDDPKTIAEEIREYLYPTFVSDLKEFLRALIEKLAEHNIFVFEFVETWNKRIKQTLMASF